MKFTLLTAVGILLLINCTHKFTRVAYTCETNATSYDACRPLITKNAPIDSLRCNIIGILILDDNFFNTKWTQVSAIDTLIKEACCTGADEINIIKDSKDIRYKSYAATAIFIKYDTDLLPERKRYQYVLDLDALRTKEKMSGIFSLLAGISLIAYFLFLTKYGEMFAPWG